jgi:hydrogenase maturation protease
MDGRSGVTAQEERPVHVLIAGVGYSFLHDWSVGPKVVTMLQERSWPAGVDIDDWSFSPLDGIYRLGAADPPFDRTVFFGAIERGRPVGSVVRRRWHSAELPSPEVVQECVGEAISGVINLDNLVFVCGAFKALPEDVVLIEVEPLADESWGDGFSPAVEAAIPELLAYIEREAALVAAPAFATHEDRP